MKIENLGLDNWDDVMRCTIDNNAGLATYTGAATALRAPGFISQIASVLEIALTMLTLERRKMHGTFVFFLQLT